MENNEITMCMDVKIDKRPDFTRFHEWKRAQVKVEAVKCFPCFLRITLNDEDTNADSQPIIISINVPGVNITLASSRTKQHSYAICWTQCRKSCFIYFALETELSCRRHMKWMRKSIKNLELHRKLLLEERRISRTSTNAFPQLIFDDFKNDSTWSQQRVSEIYEEIFEGIPQEMSEQQRDSRRISRRCSRTSIASGIYEEMKLPTDLPIHFNAINEEVTTTASTTIAPTPPPLPPLPPLRKRFNTYKNDEVPNSPPIEAIPRCSTNPETELAKKKKYKNMLDNIFNAGGLRSKRTVSNSESNQEQLKTPKPTKSTNLIKLKSTEIVHTTNEATTTLSTDTSPKHVISPMFANDDAIAAKRPKKPDGQIPIFNAAHSKRNSFSSPDLSKINFIDTFDEQRIAEMLNPSFLKCDDLDFTNSASLDDSVMLPVRLKNSTKRNKQTSSNTALEQHNVSNELPHNFNYSACNSSSINLIAPLNAQMQVPKNKILFDDLTGYCVMAPIVRKMSSIDNTALPSTKASATPIKTPLTSASSGYSTGSFSSITSTKEEQLVAKTKEIDESVVYMNMQEPLILKEIATPPSLADDFTGNLYENLLALKATRELEMGSMNGASAVSTSTPTESPHLVEATTTATNTVNTPTSTKIVISTEEDENFYQTPRKSIISIDEKVPSYYPNTCETSIKSRRRSYSPARLSTKALGSEDTPTTSCMQKSTGASPSASTTSNAFRNLVSSKLRHERKENLYLTSPQGIIEQQKSSTKTTSVNTLTRSTKSKKTSAHKISENVYAVKCHLKKSVTNVPNDCNTSNQKHNINSVEGKTTLNEADMLSNLAILQSIDFKFEDTKTLNIDHTEEPTTPIRIPNLHSHHLKVNQSSNTCYKLRAHSVGNSPATLTITTPTVAMTQSSKTNATACNDVEIIDPQSTNGIKKFASLPRFKKFDLSPLRMRIHNVLQRNHTPDL